MKSIEIFLNAKSLFDGPLLDDMDNKFNLDNPKVVEYYQYLRGNDLYQGELDTMFPAKEPNTDGRGYDGIIFLDLNNHRRATSQNLRVLIYYKNGEASTASANIEVLFICRELVSIKNTKQGPNETMLHDVKIDDFL